MTKTLAAGVLTKLATALPGARNFFVSYVMLSGAFNSSSRVALEADA